MTFDHLTILKVDKMIRHFFFDVPSLVNLGHQFEQYGEHFNSIYFSAAPLLNRFKAITEVEFQGLKQLFCLSDKMRLYPDFLMPFEIVLQQFGMVLNPSSLVESKYIEMLELLKKAPDFNHFSLMRSEVDLVGFEQVFDKQIPTQIAQNRDYFMREPSQYVPYQNPSGTEAFEKEFKKKRAAFLSYMLRNIEKGEGELNSILSLAYRAKLVSENELHIHNTRDAREDDEAEQIMEKATTHYQGGLGSYRAAWSAVEHYMYNPDRAPERPDIYDLDYFLYLDLEAEPLNFVTTSEFWAHDLKYKAPLEGRVIHWDAFAKASVGL